MNDRRSVSRAAPAVALACALVTYVALAARHISCPGLGYDETMWATVAIDRPDGGWVAWSVGRWPVVLALPYIGALKGYLYRPIIDLFGANAWSVRAPMIALGALSIVGIFGIARMAYGGLAAALAAVLVATHPEFIQRTRHDLGPATPDLFFQVTCAFFLLRYRVTSRDRDAVAFWSLAALGIWNKITFIWYVNAFVVAFAALGASAPVRVRPGAGRCAAHAAAYAILAGWVAWVYLAFSVPQLQASLGSGASQPWGERLVTFWRDFGHFAAGEESIRFFYDAPAFAGSTSYVLALGLFAAIGVARAARSRRQEDSGARTMLLIVALAIVVQVIATRPADKAWHRMSLIAPGMLLVADGLSAALRWLASRVASVRAAAVASVAVCGALLMHPTLVDAYHDRVACLPAENQRGFNRATQTRATWQLLDEVARRSRRFVFLDWGMRNQAVLVTRSPERLFEYRAADLRGAGAALFSERHLGSDDIFVLHGAEYACDPEVRDAFFALLRRSGVTPRRITTIRDGPYTAFELWETTRAPPPSAR